MKRVSLHIRRFVLHPEQVLLQPDNVNGWHVLFFVLAACAMAAALKRVAVAPNLPINVFVLAGDSLIAVVRTALIWLLWVTGLAVVARLKHLHVAAHRIVLAAALVCTPFAARALFQVGYLLITQQPLGRPGISGLADTNSPALLRGVLAQIDLFQIWQWLVAAACLAALGLASSRIAVLPAMLLWLCITGFFAVMAAILGSQG